MFVLKCLMINGFTISIFFLREQNYVTSISGAR